MEHASKLDQEDPPSVPIPPPPMPPTPPSFSLHHVYTLKEVRDAVVLLGSNVEDTASNAPLYHNPVPAPEVTYLSIFRQYNQLGPFFDDLVYLYMQSFFTLVPSLCDIAGHSNQRHIFVPYELLFARVTNQPEVLTWAEEGLKKRDVATKFFDARTAQMVILIMLCKHCDKIQQCVIQFVTARDKHERDLAAAEVRLEGLERNVVLKPNKPRDKNKQKSEPYLTKQQAFQKYHKDLGETTAKVNKLRKKTFRQLDFKPTIEMGREFPIGYGCWRIVKTKEVFRASCCRAMMVLEIRDGVPGIITCYPMQTTVKSIQHATIEDKGNILVHMSLMDDGVFLPYPVTWKREAQKYWKDMFIGAKIRNNSAHAKLCYDELVNAARAHGRIQNPTIETTQSDMEDYQKGVDAMHKVQHHVYIRTPGEAYHVDLEVLASDAANKMTCTLDSELPYANNQDLDIEWLNGKDVTQIKFRDLPRGDSRAQNAAQAPNPEGKRWVQEPQPGDEEYFDYRVDDFLERTASLEIIEDSNTLFDEPNEEPKPSFQDSNNVPSCSQPPKLRPKFELDFGAGTIPNDERTQVLLALKTLAGGSEEHSRHATTPVDAPIGFCMCTTPSEEIPTSFAASMAIGEDNVPVEPDQHEQQDSQPGFSSQCGTSGRRVLVPRYILDSSRSVVTTVTRPPTPPPLPVNRLQSISVAKLNKRKVDTVEQHDQHPEDLPAQDVEEQETKKRRIQGLAPVSSSVNDPRVLPGPSKSDKTSSKCEK